MANQTIPNSPETSIELSKKTRFEQAKMADVTFLLESLFIKEEAMIKEVLNCLYDVGSVNLINQRVQRQSLNRVAKWVARFSKPVFRIIALRWFKRNCPNLITAWLYTQVKFEPHKIAQVVEAAEDQTDEITTVARLAEATERTAIQPAPVAELETYRQEVRRLHSQVKVLTVLLVGITATLGSGLIWSLERSQTQSAHLNQLLQADVAKKEQPCSAQILQPCH